MEHASHERRLAKAQRFEAIGRSSSRDRTDGESLHTASKISLAAGLEHPPAKPWCARSCSYDPAARSRAPTSETCVCRLSTCSHSVPRFGIRTFKRRAWTPGGRPHHHGHWAPFDSIQSARGLQQRGYDLFIMHISHHSMNAGGTDRYNSTPSARLRPHAHSTRSRTESALKAFEAKARMAPSVASSATIAHIVGLIKVETDVSNVTQALIGQKTGP